MLTALIVLAVVAALAVAAVLMFVPAQKPAPRDPATVIAMHTQPRARIAAPVDPREELIASYARLQKRR